MKKILLTGFVLILVLSLFVVADDPVRVGGSTGTLSPAEKVCLDVSCFINNDPISSLVYVKLVDSEGSIYEDKIDELSSEDGRVRFDQLIKGKTYYVYAEEKHGGAIQPMVRFKTHEIIKMDKSKTLALYLAPPSF